MKYYLEPSCSQLAIANQELGVLRENPDQTLTKLGLASSNLNEIVSLNVLAVRQNLLEEPVAQGFLGLTSVWV